MIYASVCLIFIISRLIIINGMKSTNSGLQTHWFSITKPKKVLFILSSTDVNGKLKTWKIQTKKSLKKSRIVDFLPIKNFDWKMFDYCLLERWFRNQKLGLWS